MRFEMSRVGPYMRHTSLVRGEIVTDGAIRLMAGRGVAAVTLRALADEFRISPPAVRQWFAGTDKMWDQIVRRFGSRWVASLTDPWRDDPTRTLEDLRGFHRLLPCDAGDIAATRAWLAITQLARDDETLGAALAPYEAKEVEVVAHLADRYELDSGCINVDVLVAVIRGLRHAVCASDRPMALARAHAVLSEVLLLLPPTTTPDAAAHRPLF